MSDNPSDKKLFELSTVSVGRLLWKYSLPAVVGMLVMALYNVVDRIFIGQWVGPDAIAGLAVTFPVMNLTTAIGVLIGVGASARVSIVLGAGRPDRAQEMLGNALSLTIINGIIYIGFFMYFIDPLLLLFGASQATLPYAREYMLVILPGCLLTNLTFGLNNIMRASGYPGRAMVTMMIGAVVNVGLDPLFIYVFEWGIGGAALATDIAMLVSAIFVLAHFMRRDSTLRFTRGIYRLRWRTVVAIISIGAAPAVVNAASCIVNAIANNSLLRYGDDRDIGAVGIMVTFTSLLVTVVLGICQGMQPVVGYNYGSGRLDRVARAIWISIGAGVAVTTVGWVGGEFFPHFIARAFVNDAALVDFTAHALRLAMITFWMVGMQIIATTYFQSIGKIGLSIFLSLTRQVLFFVPLLIILPRHWGLDGIWGAFFSSDICSTTVTVILMVYAFRDLRRRQLDQQVRE